MTEFNSTASVPDPLAEALQRAEGFRIAAEQAQAELAACRRHREALSNALEQKDVELAKVNAFIAAITQGGKGGGGSPVAALPAGGGVVIPPPPGAEGG